MVERPLARFGGERPAEPEWYRALSIEPDEIRHPVVDGARIEVLVWGEPGKPGILLAHGSRAHARWWGPVAPLLAQRYRVASFSWTGMGGSDWRPEYSIDQEVIELFAAAEAGGLLATGTPPVFIAHSFGTRALAQAAIDRGNELSGAILVDGIVASTRRPPLDSMLADPHYGSLAEGLARFNLKPAQQCENLFILDDIARASLEETAKGWRWRFDPEFHRKFVFTDVWPSIAKARCPLALVHGDKSSVLTPDELDAQKAQAPAGTPFVEIPNAGHHIMADQPIALTVALRTLVETWLSARRDRREQ
jgi:pimeloyl-ACP methyl ester carboxylesterase